MNDHFKTQESFCENTGVAGILLSLTGLFQLLYIMKPMWISFVLVGIYVLSIFGFSILTTKSRHAFYFLLVSTILTFLMTVFVLISNIFSLVLLVLFIYSLVIVVLMKTSDVDLCLQRRSLAKKEELEKWNGIL